MRAGPGPEAPTLRASGAPAPRAMLVVAGEGFLSTYELDRELVIGRAVGCDVVVDHPALSRRHAAIAPGPPPAVRDLGSTNGTRIGAEVRRGGDAVALAAGDGFRIGPFSFVVVGGGARADASMSVQDVLRIADPTAAGASPVVARVAAGTVSVLVLGETGAGKEVLAQTLHALSGRTGPLARINCAALSESLLESELFGHEKGAFTGATSVKVGLLEGAEGGTVFLDEVGELPLSLQAKLLRAVERREVLRVGAIRPRAIDVRFIAATNRDLVAEVEAGRFRRDLFFRLDGVTLVIPPLRERRAQIARLAAGFLRDAGGAGPLAPEVIAALEAHGWPGNVRELKAVIERAVLLAADGPIGVKHLAFARSPVRRPDPIEAAGVPTPPPPPRRTAPATAAAPPEDEPLDFLDDAQRRDRAQIIAVLDACAGNQTRAARELGIGRTTLLQKLRLYRIPRPRA